MIFRRSLVVFCILFIVILVGGCSSNNKSQQASSNAILSITLKSSSGSNNDGAVGKYTLKYRKNGQEKEYVFDGETGLDGVFFLDINDDNTKQVVIPTRIDVNLGTNNAGYLYWENVYDFDFNNEKLVLASNKYPRYYTESYINKLEAIAKRGTIDKRIIEATREVAKQVASGKFVIKDPKDVSKKVASLLNVGVNTTPASASSTNNTPAQANSAPATINSDWDFRVVDIRRDGRYLSVSITGQYLGTTSRSFTPKNYFVVRKPGQNAIKSFDGNFNDEKWQYTSDTKDVYKGDRYNMTVQFSVEGNSSGYIIYYDSYKGLIPIYEIH